MIQFLLLTLSFFIVSVSAANGSNQESRQKALSDAVNAYNKALDVKNSNNVPLWEMLPQTSAMGKIDYQQAIQLPVIQKSPTTKVSVFISFSMPEDSIKRLMIEASSSRQPERFKFIINGLDPQTKSLLKTQQKIANLSKGHKVEVVIDPGEFEMFDVQRVPAFVVYKDDPFSEAQCAIDGKKVQDSEYLKVYGDVSISQAIDFIDKNKKTKDSLEIKSVSESLHKKI